MTSLSLRRSRMSSIRTFGALLRGLLVLCLTSVITAEVHSQATAEATSVGLRLASPLTDNMVLQQGMKTPFWGVAEPGQTVRVEIAGSSSEVKADDDGRWQVSVGPLELGKPLTAKVTAGDQAIQLDNILVGEVWIASGQSNMEWPLHLSDNPDAEIAAADFPNIRLFDVPHRVADQPQEFVETAGWQPCTPETIRNFSAVAYFFGQDLHRKLDDVPIGLMSVNWGGTQMEAWTSREKLQSSETFAPLFGEDGELTKQYDRDQDRPAALFNGMLAPTIPYGIRGAIWYQGESNAGRANQYRELSELMITDWRERWGQGDFPFLLVQLSAWEPGGDNWPFLREAQLQTLQLPTTGMAVTTDIGHRTDIHPRNKQDVGKRLALAARAIAYNEDVVYSGPLFKAFHVNGSSIELTFSHVGSGLMAKDGELRGFEVAGSDGKFVPANASIDGEQIILRSDQVNAPTAARYNWSAFPDGNLYNAEGLPASPFRTP